MKKTTIILFALLLIGMVFVGNVFAKATSVKITDVEFYKDGVLIDEIENGTITVSVNIASDNISHYNEADGKDEGFLIAAVYEGKALCRVVMMSRDYFSGNNRVSGEIEVTDASKQTVKIMSWSKENGLKSFGTPVVLSSNSNRAVINSLTVNNIKAEINGIDGYIWIETEGGANITSVNSLEIDAIGTLSPSKEQITSLSEGDILTVTAEDGTKTKAYTVRFERRQNYYSMATMDVEMGTKNYPSKGGTDKFDWDTNTLAAGYSRMETEKIINGETVQDKYFWYSTTATKPAVGMDLGKRSWDSVLNTESEKVTYTFDLNIFENMSEWNKIDVSLGTNTPVKLWIMNHYDCPSDSGVLRSNFRTKYQLRYRYKNSNGNGANIATLNCNEWYNIKVVVRRFSATQGLVEIYINDEMVFSTPNWFGKPGGEIPILSTINYATNGARAFAFMPFSDALFTMGLDNIGFYFTDANQPEKGQSTDVTTVRVLGDSISVIYTNPNVDQQGFSKYLKEALVDGIGFVDYSKAGNDTQRYLDGGYMSGGNWQTIPYSWSDIKKQIKSGDVVIFALGTNDQYHGSIVTEAIFKQNYRQLLAEARALGATPLMITPHASATYPNFTRNEFAEYAGYVREIAAETGTTCIDVNTVMFDDLKQKLENGMEMEDIIELYFAADDGNNAAAGGGTDLVHLSDVGARYVANIIVSLIKASNSPVKGLFK